MEGELTARHSRQENGAGSRASVAFGLAVLSVMFAGGGFLVSGFLTLLGLVAAVASATVAVRALRRGSGGAAKTLALAALVLAVFVVLAVAWLTVAFIVNPPD